MPSPNCLPRFGNEKNSSSKEGRGSVAAGLDLRSLNSILISPSPLLPAWSSVPSRWVCGKAHGKPRKGHKPYVSVTTDPDCGPLASIEKSIPTIDSNGRGSIQLLTNPHPSLGQQNDSPGLPRTYSFTFTSLMQVDGPFTLNDSPFRSTEASPEVVPNIYSYHLLYVVFTLCCIS